MGSVIHQSDRALVCHAPWQELLCEVDALIVDAPYSERTHKGHADGAVTANRAGDWSRSHAAKDAAAARVKYEASARSERKSIEYPAWSPEDVRAFVAAWAPITRGWIVSLTDHVLVPVWSQALTDAGRYVFSPLACVEPGSRVRMGGDGPAQWSCWAIVSRPKNRTFQKWGALPGAYVVPPGSGRSGNRKHGEGKPIAGGKNPWIMDRLVEHYSKPGDLVCDPCAGAGTTLASAIRAGRRALGGDLMLEHAQLSADACKRAEAEQVPASNGGAP